MAIKTILVAIWNLLGALYGHMVHGVSQVIQVTWGAISWVWHKFWSWEIVSWLVSVVCIGLAFLLAQYALYNEARILLVVGTVLLAGHAINVLRKERGDKISTAEMIVAGVLISGVLVGLCQMGIGFIHDIEWKNEVQLLLLFKQPNPLTQRQQDDYVLALNAYYHYLTRAGLDLPTDVPPIGIQSVAHGNDLFLAGGPSNAPSYYSSLTIVSTRPDFYQLRWVYSAYEFNRLLTWNSPNTSREDYQNREVAAWICECYFPQSFDGLQRCGEQSPGYKWTAALLDARRQFGQQYVDSLVAYTLRMWNGVPAKYTSNFDQWFRYKLATGESVVDNGAVAGDTARFQQLDEILKKYNIDVTQP